VSDLDCAACGGRLTSASLDAGTNVHFAHELCVEFTRAQMRKRGGVVVKNYTCGCVGEGAFQFCRVHAAAYEMLEALERCVSEWGKRDSFLLPSELDALQFARAVIAKAQRIRP